MSLPPFPDRIHFAISFPAIPEPVAKVWQTLCNFLSSQGSLPQKFEVSQIAGHVEKYHSTVSLSLTPAEVGDLIHERQLDGFHVSTGHSAGSVAYHLGFGQRGASVSTLSCRIEHGAKAPGDWAQLIEQVTARWPTFGGWQWGHLYRVWQWVMEVHDYYETRFGPLPPGYKRSYKKVESLQPQPDRMFVDISMNPGRPKQLIRSISFYPTAEMWLGPHFWQYAKCTKEEVLAADFFLEKRDTPHFLYLKSWPEPFTRPDGEQGRQQQRLWKLLFREDCEWPPGSGGICDEPMYGPPELMPGASQHPATTSELDPEEPSLTPGRRRNFRDPGFEEARERIEACRLKEQRELQLSGLGLTQLPEEVGQLQSVEEIYLCGNRLTVLPDVIGNLASLKSLWIRCNELRQLPSAIGNLKALQELHLSENKLEELPLQVGGLAALGQLTLGGNRLVSLPETIGELQNLRMLALSGNLLEGLPESIVKLKRLERLLIERNVLARLPEKIGKVSHLRELYLAGNNLREIPESIGELESLTWLDLGGNQLRTVPASLGRMPRLNYLRLSENRIVNLPDSMAKLRNLENLSLCKNGLRQVPPVVFKIGSLLALDLSDNDLECLPPEIGRLQALLQLLINRNMLTQLPDEIGKLKSLVWLCAVTNELKVIPASLGELPSLKRLTLADNQLTFIPESIGSMRSLQFLDLANNRLQGLPESVVASPTIKALELRGNPISATTSE
jgi:Leucine-rich repeat (LRR) protein